MGLGTPVLPPLPKDTGDRNRTSPFAFTGNKFEFARGLQPVAEPAEHRAEHIVAEAIDLLCEDLEAAMAGTKKKPGVTFEQALPAVLGAAYTKARPVIFGGDNYDEVARGRRAGLLDLRTTPDALPELISEQTVSAFSNYGVLDGRELHARYDVMLEQYVSP